jgi:hypothetical protein
VSAQQPVLVGGQIQYKRKYTLWVLILLIIVCWPVAIIYYFTRDKVAVQEYQTYGQPVGYGQPPPPPGAAPAGGKTCPACGAQNAANAGFCIRCGKPL